MVNEMSRIKLEICVDGIESAHIAEKAGADRLELCGELGVGGLTPSMGLLKQALSQIGIPINVMIRPRSGDFCYTNDEINTMKENIRIIKDRFPSVNGFVFGIISSEGIIDKAKMSELIELAHPIPVTIHRAFDMTKDMNVSLETCIDLGIERVLTAGFTNKAIEGIENLKLLTESAKDKLVIMPGSGINSKNLTVLLDHVKIDEVHMSAKKVVSSLMNYKEDGVSMGRDATVDEFERFITDNHEIAQVKEILKQYD